MRENETFGEEWKRRQEVNPLSELHQALGRAPSPVLEQVAEWTNRVKFLVEEALLNRVNYIVLIPKILDPDGHILPLERLSKLMRPFEVTDFASESAYHLLVEWCDGKGLSCFLRARTVRQKFVGYEFCARPR